MRIAMTGNPNSGKMTIVDATNLSRSLFFTTQLLELGIPVVVALNKSDINEKKDTKIDEKALAEKLGCPVIKTTPVTAAGLKEVINAAAAITGFIAKENVVGTLATVFAITNFIDTEGLALVSGGNELAAIITYMCVNANKKIKEAYALGAKA